MQLATPGQIVDRGRAGVGRADLEQEVRPQPCFFQQGLSNEVLGSRIGDDEE